MTTPTVAHARDDFESCSCDACRRAAIAWQQYESLRRLAQRRTGSWADAEDAAHEAIVRALEASDIDLEQLPAWLTRVTLNLCVDMARDRARQHKRVRYHVMQQAAERDVESAVLDRIYSYDAYNLAMSLPPAQRTAVMMRADGRSVIDVAQALDVSPKAAESLLSRARATVRRGLGALTPIFLVLRRKHQTVAPLAVSTAALSTLLLLAPSVPGHAAKSPMTPHRVHTVPTVADAAVQAPERTHQAPAPGQSHTIKSTTTPPAGSSHRTLVAPREAHVGPLQVHDGGAGWTHAEQSLSQSIRQCLDEGVDVSTSYVGCKDADNSPIKPL